MWDYETTSQVIFNYHGTPGKYMKAQVSHQAIRPPIAQNPSMATSNPECNEAKLFYLCFPIHCKPSHHGMRKVGNWITSSFYQATKLAW